MSFLCGASIAIPENFVMTTAYARPSVQTPRTGELKGKTLKVREREPRYAARNCLEVSLLRGSQSICVFFFDDDDSNSKTYRVHINVRYFH